MRLLWSYTSKATSLKYVDSMNENGICWSEKWQYKVVGMGHAWFGTGMHGTNGKGVEVICLYVGSF